MNIVVIVADSLRFDYMGCYGSDWVETPRLDALAEESLVFDNAYVEGMPRCRAARLSSRGDSPFRSAPGAPCCPTMYCCPNCCGTRATELLSSPTHIIISNRK